MEINAAPCRNDQVLCISPSLSRGWHLQQGLLCINLMLAFSLLSSCAQGVTCAVCHRSRSERAPD